MLSLEQALAHYNVLRPSATHEHVALEHALGRVLAEDVASTLDLPPMRQSAMDGYAVHAADLAAAKSSQPVLLPLHQSVAAGQQAKTLPAGHCARIFTGAPMPPGADSVEIQENVEAQSAGVRFSQPVAQGRNVRQQGEELRAGHILLRAGQRLNAAQLSIIAGAGHAQVSCLRQPRVAIIVSGSELVAPATPRTAAQIFESNGTFLRHFALQNGAQVSQVTLCPDDPAQLQAHIATALNEADMLLISGGASVGDHDHSRSAAQACGIEEQFWKVAQKPGKPLSFGLGPQGQAVFILPGNPASVYACAMVHVRQALARLCGTPAAPRIQLQLGGAVRADSQRMRLLRGHVHASRGGQLVLTALPHQASHMTSNLASANAIACIPAGADLAAGSVVECWISGALEPQPEITG